ncbi:hypothetical protein TNCV_3725771 [Trichonephila clavipes]|nr:hypothetical protein TNCV_3725771 [Trichonephila clavipes]
MQITGNHQMARIVRHNDESVREGYIRNGSKEVKLLPRRSTVATPPGFHRPTKRRHAIQQKENPHSRHVPH